MKKFLAGFAWFIVLWLGGELMLGIASGVLAASRHPVDAYGAGFVVGKSLARYGSWVLGGALLLSVVGTAAGLLPGTRGRKPTVNAPENPSQEVELLR